jgi:hypothetical protein
VSDGYLWRLEDHVCAGCVGRVLARQTDDGQTVVRCSNCGREVIGDPPTICACGVTKGKYARLRCVRLDRPIPGVDSEIVAAEAK